MQLDKQGYHLQHTVYITCCNFIQNILQTYSILDGYATNFSCTNENGSTHSNFAHRLRRYNCGVRRIANSNQCTGHYCTETNLQHKMLKDIISSIINGFVLILIE